MRASRLFSRWSSVRPLRFQRIPFRRDVVLDPGGATAPRITVPHLLPSTLVTGSASATLSISRLNLTPQQIAVYASQSPSPTPTQHSLPGGPLRPYPCRSFTGWNTPASPDAPQVPDATGFLPDPCNKVTVKASRPVFIARWIVLWLRPVSLAASDRPTAGMRSLLHAQGLLAWWRNPKPIVQPVA